MDELVTRRIANCPTPEFHETHRYCPSCPWTEPQEPSIEVVEELPPRLEGAVRHWLEVNQREAVQVRHGVFPLGMVQRWMERAEEAEAKAVLWEVAAGLYRDEHEKDCGCVGCITYRRAEAP